ncbi:MAG: restriction endonuclease subunit S [Phycisphaerales bacterium]
MVTGDRLEKLCLEVVDCPHSTPNWTEDGVLVLRSPNIRDGRLNLSEKSFTDEEHYAQRSRRAEVKAGDLIITREAPMGEVCMIPEGLRCCLGQRMVLLRPDLKKVDGRFLLYALQSPQVQHQIGWSEGTGSTVSNLRIPHLKSLQIPHFEHDEQRAIARVLGALDDKIEQNRRTAAKLEELARATFHAWFVDFAPIHAKASGQTAHPGLPPAAFAALPTSFVESPVGPIPEGWTCEPLDALANIVGGGTPKRSNEVFWGNDVPWYSVKDAPDSGQAWVINTTESISQAGLDGSSARVLPEAATIISARGTVGRLALAGVPMAFNQSCYGLIETEKALPFTLYQALHLAVAELQRRTHGAVFDTITRQTFSGVELAWPPLSLVDAMESFLQPLYLSMRQHLQESHHLAALRDYLLPRLLSGAVRVRGSEQVEGTS